MIISKKMSAAPYQLYRTASELECATMQWVVHSSSRSPHISLGYRTSEDMEASPAADNLTHEKIV
ncbi:hypothetical protein BBM1454_11100 [Bifidobacterium breve MCC 1454]|nr:hypothetical protein BBM1454_11100 [Bifidobacterium breve MCC 1454]